MWQGHGGHHVYDNSYHICAANARAGLSHDYSHDDDCIALEYEGAAYTLAWHGREGQVPSPTQITEPQSGEVLSCQIYYKGKHQGKKQLVVQRDDANLTSDDVKNHWGEVASAIQKELETWV